MASPIFKEGETVLFEGKHWRVLDVRAISSILRSDPIGFKYTIFNAPTYRSDVAEHLLKAVVAGDLDLVYNTETGNFVRDFEDQVRTTLEKIGDLLIEKNKAYGNSALDPVRIFSKSDATEQLRVRIDDKLSRFARGSEYPGDDTVTDLLGYLVLLKIALNDAEAR